VTGEGSRWCAAVTGNIAVDAGSLPHACKITHVSLFDGTNCGIRVENRAIFSVQYHPEASPGPMAGMRPIGT